MVFFVKSYVSALYVGILISINIILTSILVKKWLFVRGDETYRTLQKFRILWFLFLFKQSTYVLKYFFEFILVLKYSSYIMDLKCFFSDSCFTIFMNIEIQMIILVTDVINNTNINNTKNTSNYKYLHLIPISLFILMVPYLLASIFHLSTSSETTAQEVHGVAGILNAIFIMGFSLWIAKIFFDLIKIIKQNPLLRNSNKKAIRRWKIFLIVILCCAMLSLLIEILSLLDHFGVGPFNESGSKEGYVCLYRSNLAYDALRLVTSLIIVFLSPYSYIHGQLKRQRS